MLFVYFIRLNAGKFYDQFYVLKWPETLNEDLMTYKRGAYKDSKFITHELLSYEFTKYFKSVFFLFVKIAN